MARIKDLQSIAEDFNPSDATGRVPPAAQRAKSAPVAMMEFSADYRQLTLDKQELERTQGHAREIALDLIVENPLHAQIRALDENQVTALMENLRENPLASPITVRRLGDHFELVGGRHRLAAFRRLGRETIPAVIREYDDEDAARALVFDNLIQPNLSDFERYQGIAALRARFGWSYTDLNEHTGLSRAWLSFLMQFSKLNDAAIAALRKNPGCISSHQLRDLIPLCPDPEKLSEIVIEVAEKRSSLNAAVAQLRGRPVIERAKKTEITDMDDHRYAVVKYKDRLISVEIDPNRMKHAPELRRRITELVREFAGAADSEQPGK